MAATQRKNQQGKREKLKPASEGRSSGRGSRQVETLKDEKAT